MDYSFLRLLPTFNEAKQMMFDPRQSTHRYYDCIALHPIETYLQITASKVDIVFNGSYKVSVIDSCEKELKDISESVTIFEFFDKNGVAQIAYEIAGIGQSWYGETVYLKFENTVGIERFYSNAFTVSDENINETVRLIYKSYGWFQGTDYTNAPYLQSIRIKCEFQKTDDATETATYTQTSGNVLSLNPTVVMPKNYTIDYINNFTFMALSVALKSDVKYLDYYRVTDRPQLKNGDRLGNSNVTPCEFTAHIDLDDNIDDVSQLTPAFTIATKYPLGTLNTTLTETNKISVSFNKSIMLGIGQLKIFGVGGFLISTLTQSDFSVSGNTLTSNDFLSDYLSVYGNYYITFTEGLVKSNIGENISINNNQEWTFNFGAGDWSADDWSSDDWLIYE